MSTYLSVYYALFRGIGNDIGQAKCTLWQGGARVVRNCVAALGVSRGNPRTLPGFWKKDFAFSWEAGDLPGGMVVYIQIERSGVCKCLWTGMDGFAVLRDGLIGLRKSIYGDETVRVAR